MKTHAFNRVPKVVIAETPENIKFLVLPIAGLSSSPVFNNIETEEIAEMLMYFLRYPREAVMPIEGRVATWLHTDDGELWFMNINQPPWSLV